MIQAVKHLHPKVGDAYRVELMRSFLTTQQADDLRSWMLK